MGTGDNKSTPKESAKARELILGAIDGSPFVDGKVKPGVRALSDWIAEIEGAVTSLTADRDRLQALWDLDRAGHKAMRGDRDSALARVEALLVSRDTIEESRVKIRAERDRLSALDTALREYAEPGFDNAPAILRELKRTGAWTGLAESLAERLGQARHSERDLRTERDAAITEAAKAHDEVALQRGTLGIKMGVLTEENFNLRTHAFALRVLAMNPLHDCNGHASTDPGTSSRTCTICDDSNRLIAETTYITTAAPAPASPLMAAARAAIEASSTAGHQLGCSCQEDDGSSCDCIQYTLPELRRAAGVGE